MSDSFVTTNRRPRPEPVKEIKRTTSAHRPPPPPPRSSSVSDLPLPPPPREQSRNSQRKISQPITNTVQQVSYGERKTSAQAMNGSTTTTDSVSRDVVYTQNEEITIKCLTIERNYDNLKNVARKG